MGLLASISKNVLLIAVTLLLFSFETMKTQDDILEIPISWNSADTRIFSVEGATYPDELNGLPLVSVSLEQSQATDFAILNVRKTEFSPLFQEKLALRFPSGTKTGSLRKLKERGNDVMFIDIFPILFDSVSEKYFKIEYLEIQLEEYSRKSTASHLRTGENIDNSALAAGDWYKIPVTENGVHKLDYTYLKNAGINVSGINPKKLVIRGNGGGMLPQLVSEDRPVDLIENAILVAGEEDGRFDEQDYILFYGQGANHQKINEVGELEYEKNYYSDTTFYFLTISSEDGLRIAQKEDLGLTHPKINSFDDYIIYEKDEFNIINSGREWYGEKFDFTLTYNFTFDFPDLIPDTELTVTSAVMGQTYEEASMDLKVNGVELGQQRINDIVEGSYLAKGSSQIDEFTINTTSIPSVEQFTVQMSFNPTGAGKSKANLNYLTVLGKRKLRFHDNQLRFRSLESIQNAISTYEIEHQGATFQVWDITNPLQPYDQKISSNGDLVSFGGLGSELKEFVAFRNQDYLIPEKATQIHNQNLHASPNVDFLIVTYAGFISEAERLAELRRNHDGLKVLVVTTEEIYNEFSSGKQDVTAIRDYAKYMYDLGDESNKLQNVLLFGRGSFDYKDRISDNTNFVPIYSSRNTLHPINSYSSDDYFGFFDENEGMWEESYSGDHLMDIGVGRLPVKSLEEAKVIVDKLVNYSTSPSTFGEWRNELVFIADDGDGNLHQRDADRLTTLVDTSYTIFNINKIYIDAFEQIETSIGETAPGVNEEIEHSIDKGGLIFNYTGHGSVTRLASETIMNISSVSEFENKHRLPLVVTATCEFGRHDNPKAISGAEYLLLNPKGGAIGLLTTARPVFSSTNFILNKAFYKNVFEKQQGKYSSIGEIFRNTKNQSLNGSVNRNFSLLADPSMTLAYAKDNISLFADENSYQPGDTLKALATVMLKGQVKKIDGQVNSNFNGKLIATVFDTPSQIETLGHEDQVMRFSVRDNIIFKGEVSVKAGEFEVEFIVPKNITYDYEKGKVSLYALDESQNLDAAGSDIEFIIGGESQDYVMDNTPPGIELFINDTTFVSRGITRPDILLVAKLTDESGISISNSDSAPGIIAILDDEVGLILNGYYIGAQDTYKKGWVTYPYKELSIGTHKIRLQAWDVHNNFNEAEIEFLVVEDEHLAIKKLMNFPNPFRDYTRFSFEHNRAGDDLEIMIDVYSMQGKLVKQFATVRENSESRISDLVWNGKEENGSNLLSGVYIFRLSIRSLIDGSKKQANQKLVIIN